MRIITSFVTLLFFYRHSDYVRCKPKLLLILFKSSRLPSRMEISQEFHKMSPPLDFEFENAEMKSYVNRFIVLLSISTKPKPRMSTLTPQWRTITAVVHPIYPPGLKINETELRGYYLDKYRHLFLLFQLNCKETVRRHLIIFWILPSMA